MQAGGTRCPGRTYGRARRRVRATGNAAGRPAFDRFRQGSAALLQDNKQYRTSGQPNECPCVPTPAACVTRRWRNASYTAMPTLVDRLSDRMGGEADMGSVTKRSA
jgi:hypothetical protein